MRVVDLEVRVFLFLEEVKMFCLHVSQELVKKDLVLEFLIGIGLGGKL